MRRTSFLVILLAALFLGGCSHVISNEAMVAVDPLVDYARVKRDPAAYQGKTLLLGGLLVENKVTREGTDLEVVLFNLDRWGRPLDVDPIGGRFIARSVNFLDPELFKPGLEVTLTGTVVGQEVRPLKGVDYPYPVFAIGEIHLWQSPARVYGYPAYYYPASPWVPYYDPFAGPYDRYWPGYNPYWDHRPAWRYR